MNGNTLSQESTYLSFLNELARLSEAATRVREKLILLAPARAGSYLHLVQETARAMEESKAGKGTVFTSGQEAVDDLKGLRKNYARKKIAPV